MMHFIILIVVIAIYVELRDVRKALRKVIDALTRHIEAGGEIPWIDRGKS